MIKMFSDLVRAQRSHAQLSIAVARGPGGWGNEGAVGWAEPAPLDGFRRPSLHSQILKGHKIGGVFECCMCFRIMSNSRIALCGGWRMLMQVDVGNIPAPSSQGLGPVSRGPRFRWSSSLRGSIGVPRFGARWCGTCKWTRCSINQL